ncbi:hypothetical protein CR513_41867, partial [Mucuna pruriens]
MGYIYEAMDRAKEAIQKAFSGNENKYREIYKKGMSTSISCSRPFSKSWGTSIATKALKMMLKWWNTFLNLSENEEIVDKMYTELSIYKRVGGLFGLGIKKKKKNITAGGYSKQRQSNKHPEINLYQINIIIVISHALDHGS